MQTNIHPLVVFHVYRDVLDWVQRPSVAGLEILGVSPYYVVGLTSGDPLSKLAAVVGIEFPSCPLVLGTADLHFDAEDWTIVRPPNGTKDQSIGLVRF
jgi:hypothetical protein